MSANDKDWSKRVSERIDLAMRQIADARESERVSALDEAHLNDPDSPDFVKSVERQISNALLEDQIAKTAHLEERVISNDQ